MPNFQKSIKTSAPALLALTLSLGLSGCLSGGGGGGVPSQAAELSLPDTTLFSTQPPSDDQTEPATGGEQLARITNPEPVSGVLFGLGLLGLGYARRRRQPPKKIISQ